MKIIAYNVEFAKSTTPEAVALHLQDEKPDIICFSEVPSGDWTALVGKQMGMPHHYVGQIASANHEEEYRDKTGRYFGKFKSILSRTPLTGTREQSLTGTGWSPVSVVFAETCIEDKELLVGSLHIPSGVADPLHCCAAALADVMKTFQHPRIVIGGDYNDLAESAPLQSLYKQGFKNSWQASDYDLDKEKTWDTKSDDSEGVIDHLLYFGAVDAVEAHIINSGTPQSDHYAISASFTIL